ncbi:Flp family type IVb pilin [Pseudarthrobacter sulfonivorans]|uniref:Flp family type IVb pilin n=1 Tax=Pseudarthrobacter sulfonivorans TaxID=121292 RepID=UPI0027884ACB|nr:Flp family type IVb pilin [Pseudarthrobacter sulfonivorans]MDP9997762.1 pilus assembly protein Flp/PilA [Pseudarthrobacter sulfonivorans]
MTSLMVSMMAFVAGVKDRLNSEKGATATEYALLVGLIALVLVVGVGLFGNALNDWFKALGTTVGGWGKAATPPTT